MDKPKRILVFELNWLGDILFSFPFLKALKETYKDAHIVCAVVPRYRELMSENPHVDEVCLLSDKRGLLSFLEKLLFMIKLKTKKFDTCFLLKPSASKAMIAFLAGIPERIGFEGKRSRLTKTVRRPGENLHRAERIFELAKAVGIPPRDIKYEYTVPEKNRIKVRHLIGNSPGRTDYLIGIHPGGNWPQKRWDKENFIALIKKILNGFNDVRVIVTGGKNDRRLAEYISGRVDKERCFSVAGKTTLGELAAVFEACQAVISADSGPLHLASGVGTNTIGLFGPTSSKVTGQIGAGKNIVISSEERVGCQVPCYLDNCTRKETCMDLITVDEVFEAVDNLRRGHPSC